MAAFALTEAEGGAEDHAVVTRAVRDGGEYVIDGEKAYVTNAAVADVFVVIARTSDDALSAFLVPGDAVGLARSDRLPLMGHRGSALTMLHLYDCRVGAEALLGAFGAGRTVAARSLVYARLAAAAGAVGIAQRCLDISLAHARSRVVGGRAIIKNQEISFKLAQMRTFIDTSRLLTQLAAWSIGENAADAEINVACAKVHATESAARIADLAVQIFGARGYTQGGEAERLFRDARLGPLLHGPSEIHRMRLARDILEKVSR
ncbi:MAG: acyl-CoA dehydrogenase [Deltaproteobacteria bacterium]|nr:acyl-CoA dehydrogenase [Deltaproteobacteria bacterium]